MVLHDTFRSRLLSVSKEFSFHCFDFVSKNLVKATADIVKYFIAVSCELHKDVGRRGVVGLVLKVGSMSVGALSDEGGGGDATENHDFNWKTKLLIAILYLMTPMLLYAIMNATSGVKGW